jgi:low affinity Fe/Cu permease
VTGAGHGLDLPARPEQRSEIAQGEHVDRDPPRVAFSACFNTAAQWTSRQCGRPLTFTLACVVILIWAVTGPVFQYSNTWQLIINTGILMVSLIQNTRNRDSSALHLKLGELIRVSESARNRLLDLEDLPEAELQYLKGGFAKLAGKEPNALLRSGAEDLDPAGAEIEEAKEKITSAASG